MKKITVLEFKGKDKKSGLLKECIDIAVTQHKQVHKGLGGGLELLVLKNTGIANFYFKGTKLGLVNKISLGDAFKRVEELKKAQKIKRKREKDENENVPLLKDFFSIWIEEKAATLKKGSSRKMNMLSLYRHTLYPMHGYRLCEITANLVYKKLSQVSQTAGNKHNAVTLLSQCLNSATIKGLIESNPIGGIFQGTENPFKKPKATGWKTVDPCKLKEKYFEPLKNTNVLNKVFYLFIALTAFRFAECRLMQWKWINLEKGIIVIPPDAIGANKTQKELVKPVSRQIKALIEYWKQYCDPNSIYLFKSPLRDNPVSESIIPVSVNILQNFFSG